MLNRIDRLNALLEFTFRDSKISKQDDSIECTMKETTEGRMIKSTGAILDLVSREGLSENGIIRGWEGTIPVEYGFLK